MKLLFSIYGRAIIAAIVAVSIIAILFGGGFVGNIGKKSEPFVKEQNFDAYTDTTEYKDAMQKKGVPTLAFNSKHVTSLQMTEDTFKTLFVARSLGQILPNATKKILAVYDSSGQEITDRVYASGSYTFPAEGIYSVKIRIKDKNNNEVTYNINTPIMLHS